MTVAVMLGRELINEMSRASAPPIAVRLLEKTVYRVRI